jgi:hypothetical protein
MLPGHKGGDLTKS